MKTDRHARIAIAMITLLTATSAPLAAASLTDEERAAAIACLEETRDAFVAIVEGVDDEQFRFKTAPDRWSLAEIAEHLVKVESVVLDSMTEHLLPSAPRPEWTNRGASLIRDHVIRMAATNREARRFQAPEFVAPGGGTTGRADAVAAFVAARARTIELARTTNADLRARFMENPAFGMIDGYQWLLFVAAHSERHTIQAREVMADPSFPGRLGPISPDERAALAAALRESQKRVSDAVTGLSEAQLRHKPSDDRWSIAEVIEHLARAESTLLALVRSTVEKGTPQPELKGEKGPRVKDLAFVMAITNRDAKRFEAPPGLRPAGEFETPAAALEAFRERREESIAYALTVQDDLRAYFRENPGFGSMDAYQWLLLLGAHADRHVQQIDELRAALEARK